MTLENRDATMAQPEAFSIAIVVTLAAFMFVLSAAGGLGLSLNDYSLAMYERRMHLVVWRSYASQGLACASGALIVWSAVQCAVAGHYGWALVCTSFVAPNLVVFNYAFRDREHARKALELLMHDDTGRAER